MHKKMDKIGVNQKKSTCFGAVTTFDFGVNMGEPRSFGAFSEDTDRVDRVSQKTYIQAKETSEKNNLDGCDEGLC